MKDTSHRKALGHDIAQRRHAKGLTQSQLAEICGLHNSNICKIEAGKYNASIDILDRICKALGVTISLSQE